LGSDSAISGLFTIIKIGKDMSRDYTTQTEHKDLVKKATNLKSIKLKIHQFQKKYKNTMMNKYELNSEDQSSKKGKKKMQNV